jgi:hypothetical protein
MEEVKEVIKGLCKDINDSKDIEDKNKIVDVLDRVADISIRLDKADNSHEEAMSSIAANQAIKESAEIRDDRKLELEKEKAEKERKAEIAKNVIAGIGAVGTAGAALLTVHNNKQIFMNLKEWDNKDLIPVSTGWDVFRKTFKL